MRGDLGDIGVRVSILESRSTDPSGFLFTILMGAIFWFAVLRPLGHDTDTCSHLGGVYVLVPYGPKCIVPARVITLPSEP